MITKRKRIIVFLFLILYFSSLYLNATKLINDSLFGKILSLFAVFFAIIPILDSVQKRNTLFTILLLFIFTYTYTLKFYYFDKLWLSFHQVNISSVDTMNQLTTIIFIFNMIFWYFLTIPEKHLTRKPIAYNNNLLFFLNIAVFIIMTIYGNTNETIFSSGGYYLSLGTGNKNSLTEYAIIFLVASFLYSDGSKKKTVFLYLISLLYILKNLFQGGRIETVMVLFVILIFDLIYRFSFYKIIIGSLTMYLALSVFSLIRNSPESILSMHGFESLLRSSFEKKTLYYISNNQGDVLFASERMLLLVRDQVLDLYSRVEAFFYFILGVFVPFKYLPPIANLSSYRTDLYSVGGGGVRLCNFFYILIICRFNITCLYYNKSF